MRRLLEWTDALKAKYPNRELIGTEVRVETGEKDKIQLGWNRELAVRLALIDLDFTAPDFDPTGQVLVEPPQAEIPGGGIPRAVCGSISCRAAHMNALVKYLPQKDNDNGLQPG